MNSTDKTVLTFKPPFIWLHLKKCAGQSMRAALGERPVLRILNLLRERGTRVDSYDSYIPEIQTAREHAELSGMKSIDWTPDNLEAYDAALICTDHGGVDYEALVGACPLVVDTRNATRAVQALRERIVNA